MDNARLEKKAGWFESFKIYLDRRVIAILLLGFSSGLPILLVLTTLSTWLREEGVSRSTIGLFGFVMAPYALKFIWAPLVDRMPIPGLTSLMGRRRSWMLLTQLCLIAVIYGFGQTDPSSGLYWTALFAVLITFFSATQDIVIDAYRIDSLPEDKLGAGASVVVLGYRVGMWVATAGALLVADAYDWSMAYAAMAAMMMIGLATTLVINEPDGSTTSLKDKEAALQEARIRSLSTQELKPWQGVAGLLLVLGLCLLVIQPVSYLFAFIAGHKGPVDLGGTLIAAVRLALVAWGMWVGWLMLNRTPSAPGEAKDFVMVMLLWLIAEIAAYAIPEESVWFAEAYAWVALNSIWWIGNTITSFFGHQIAYDSVVNPTWLLVIGLWIRFFFCVFLYGFFYFSKRAVANFGLITAEHENTIHLWTRRAIVEPYYDFFRRYGVSIAVANFAVNLGVQSE